MKKEHVYCKNCTRDVGIKMERRRGFNLRYTGGGDPLCTLHTLSRRTVRLGSLHRLQYMRDSRSKAKQVYTPGTQAGVYSRGPLYGTKDGG